MPRINTVCVNARFTKQRLTGVQRYAQEVIQHLHQGVQLLSPPEVSLLSRGPLWEQVILPFSIPKCGLLWSPTNTGPLAVSRQVVTIHDASTLDHPEWFHPGFAAWYRFLLPRLARRVRQVITDSHFSKELIVFACQVPEGKVHVVYPGVGAQFQPALPEQVQAVCERYGLDGSYLLVVGSLEPRKNLPHLFQAWSLVQPQYQNMTVAVIGSRGYPFHDPQLADIPPGVKVLGGVPDADMPVLYSGATALVFPSIYEGFGLHVLEAMACGTPVVASNAASIPEAVGEAGVLFDPYEIEAMAEALKKVIIDIELRQELSSKGLERARQFTWEKTARQVWDVLQAAMEP